MKTQKGTWNDSPVLPDRLGHTPETQTPNLCWKQVCSKSRGLIPLTQLVHTNPSLKTIALFLFSSVPECFKSFSEINSVVPVAETYWGLHTLKRKKHQPTKDCVRNRVSALLRTSDAPQTKRGNKFGSSTQGNPGRKWCLGLQDRTGGTPLKRQQSLQKLRHSILAISPTRTHLAEQRYSQGWAVQVDVSIRWGWGLRTQAV